MTRPCSAALAAFDSGVAQLGRQIANTAPVANRTGNRPNRIVGTTTVAIKTPVNSADAAVILLMGMRAERKPVSQILASTIGTPTQATNSETRAIHSNEIYRRDTSDRSERNRISPNIKEN